MVSAHPYQHPQIILNPQLVGPFDLYITTRKDAVSWIITSYYCSIQFVGYKNWKMIKILSTCYGQLYGLLQTMRSTCNKKKLLKTKKNNEIYITFETGSFKNENFACFCIDLSIFKPAATHKIQPLWWSGSKVF